MRNGSIDHHRRLLQHSRPSWPNPHDASPCCLRSDTRIVATSPRQSERCISRHVSGQLQTEDQGSNSCFMAVGLSRLGLKGWSSPSGTCSRSHFQPAQQSRADAHWLCKNAPSLHATEALPWSSFILLLRRYEVVYLSGLYCGLTYPIFRWTCHTRFKPRGCHLSIFILTLWTPCSNEAVSLLD